MLCSVLVLCSGAACSERLVRSRRAIMALPPAVLLLVSWAGLLALRTPTPMRALYAFTLIDLAIVVISMVGVMRLLGGFEDRLRSDGDDDDGDDDSDDRCRSPLSPPPGRRPRSNHRQRRAPRPSRPRGSRRPVTTRR